MTCSFILQPARWVSAAECLCVGGAVTLCEGGGSDISDRNHDTRGGGCVSSEGGGREGGGESRSGGKGDAERTCSDSMAERLEAFVRTHVCAAAADLFLGAPLFLLL